MLNRFSSLIALACAGVVGCATPPRLPGQPRSVIESPLQLTRGGTFDDATDPTITPDGNWIAFRGTPAASELPQIYIARVQRDPAGAVTGIATPVRVTPAGSRNASPAFGMNGTSLFFASTADARVDPTTLSDGRPVFSLRYDTLAELFRADGWQRGVAAGDVRAGVDLARFPISDNRGFDGEPAISPDGRFLAFASDRAAPASAIATRPMVDLYVARVDGTNAKQLTTVNGFDGRPAWSPDGTQLAFESERRGPGQFDIYVLTLDIAGEAVPERAGRARRITSRPDARGPVWHPSGAYLVYSAADKEGGRQLRRVDADGGNDRVVQSMGNVEAPAFDDSGETIVFAATTQRAASRQIFVGRVGD